MTQAPTEALATIRDNLKTITEQYDHPDWGDPEHNIITEEEQQLTAAVALNAINLDAFHTHVLQLLGAHFTTLFDNTCNLATKDRNTKPGKLTELQNFIAEQVLIIQFATK